MPAVDVVISQAASNHTVSGVLVPAKMVPAVALTRRRHTAQEYRPSFNGQGAAPPQCGHLTPSGQRSHAR